MLSRHEVSKAQMTLQTMSVNGLRTSLDGNNGEMRLLTASRNQESRVGKDSAWKQAGHPVNVTSRCSRLETKIEEIKDSTMMARISNKQHYETQIA